MAKFYWATPDLIQKAIDVSQKAKVQWDRVPVNTKIDMFLRVADQMASTYRADLNATTMLGQAKTIIQVPRLCDLVSTSCCCVESCVNARVVDPKLFILDQDPALNFPSSGSGSTTLVIASSLVPLWFYTLVISTGR